MKIIPRILFSDNRLVSSRPAGTSAGGQSLAEVMPGERARVKDFSPALAQEKQAHLLAYGVVPGHIVKVLRHSPVTILQIEHTELALEGDLAKQILVELIA